MLQLGGCSAKPIIELANMDMCASYQRSLRYVLKVYCSFRGRVDMVDLNCGCPQNFALDQGECHHASLSTLTAHPLL